MFPGLVFGRHLLGGFGFGFGVGVGVGGGRGMLAFVERVMLALCVHAVVMCVRFVAVVVQALSWTARRVSLFL